MQHDVRHVAPMNKVRDVLVARDGPMSPYARPPNPILIDDKEWDSVADFIQFSSGSTVRYGMLHMFAQNIHLQRVFEEEEVQFYFEGFRDAQECRELRDCFVYLHDEFKPYGDDHIISILKFENEAERLVHGPKAVALFKRAQPFLGKARAMELVRMYINQEAYKCSYEGQPMHDLLRSFLELR